MIDVRESDVMSDLEAVLQELETSLDARGVVVLRHSGALAQRASPESIAPLPSGGRAESVHYSSAGGLAWLALRAPRNDGALVGTIFSTLMREGERRRLDAE